MKKILFASTALAALAIGGAASAEVEMFGDARLGAGYKVDNDGDVRDTDDEIQAISRVRFGVTMTGESDAGITFGATIRADNAIAGEGTNDDRGFSNQRAGSVFVSGAFGTLTFGDIDEAHQFHVGDLPELGLTGLGFYNELPYFGNRGGIPDGREDADEFDGGITGDNYRPTVRYDYNFAGLGVSVSTGSRLDSVAVGASYTFDFGGSSITAGGGYFDGEANSADPESGLSDATEANQWVVGAEGTFGGFNAQVNYTNAEIEDEGDLETVGVGLGTELGVFGVNAFYHRLLENPLGEDDDDAYGVDMTVDLGGGASIKGGVVRTFSVFQDDDGDTDNETIADFGISLAF
jgi:outer membrane protein OmpU